MNKKQNVICKKCGLISEPKIEKVSLPSGGFHQKAVCVGCNKFLKFLPHSNSAPTLYFGKYKGKTVAEIALTDLPYLRWMDSHDIAKGRVKTAIKEVLACKK